MSSPLAAQGRRLARKGIYVQAIVSLIAIVTVTLVHQEIALDVMFGCLSFLIPHSIFSYWVFRYAGATKNQVVAQSLSQGMKIKLILTTVLFIVAFSQFNAHPLPLLGAYATVMLSQWLAMLVLSDS